MPLPEPKLLIREVEPLVVSGSLGVALVLGDLDSLGCALVFGTLGSLGGDYVFGTLCSPGGALVFGTLVSSGGDLVFGTLGSWGAPFHLEQAGHPSPHLAHRETCQIHRVRRILCIPALFPLN